MVVGKAKTLRITATGYPKPTFTESGALPAGVTFQSSPGVGILTGTPAAGTGNDYNITFTATNSAGADADEPYDLTVIQNVVFPSNFCPPAMTVGQYTHYDQSVLAYPPFFGLGTNNDPTDDFSFTQNQNFSANSSTEDFGWTSGIPAPGTGGKYHQQYSADTDPPVGNGQDKNENCTVIVNEAPTFADGGTSVITAGQKLPTPLLIGGTTGYPKTVTVTASGGLPTGLTSTIRAASKSFGEVVHGKVGASAAGVYPITVTADNGLTSSEEYVLVVQPPGATPASPTVTLSTEPESVSYNASSQTYTATVSGGSNPTGYVQFSLGNGVTTVPLVGGQASFTTPNILDAGSYTVTASYTGDAANAPSSTTEDLTVTPDPTLVTLSGPSSTANGVPGTFTATVACSPACGTTPSGYIQFDEAGDFNYTGWVSEVVNGQATFSTDPTTNPGSNEVDATFFPWSDGPGDFSPSAQVASDYDVGLTSLSVEAGDTVSTDPITPVADGDTVSVAAGSSTEFSATLNTPDAQNGTPPGPLVIDLTTESGGSTTDITSTAVPGGASEDDPSADPETGQTDYFWTIPAGTLSGIAASGTATVTISSPGSDDFESTTTTFTLQWS
jgi:Bacterial Ig-like domain (group 3)/Putative Ig domain